MPASKLDRLNLNANITLSLSPQPALEYDGDVSRTSHNDFQNEGWFGVTRTLVNLPPNRDIRTGVE